MPGRKIPVLVIEPMLWLWVAIFLALLSYQQQCFWHFSINGSLSLRNDLSLLYHFSGETCLKVIHFRRKQISTTRQRLKCVVILHFYIITPILLTKISWIIAVLMVRLRNAIYIYNAMQIPIKFLTSTTVKLFVIQFEFDIGVDVKS